MKSQFLTVSEVIRLANHDFLNHLQLINMNLELGRVDEAKNFIKYISQNYEIYSNMSKLRLPKTVEWLQTFNWRYPIFQVTLKSNVTAPFDMKKDDEIVEYLEKTVIQVYDYLDAFTEQQLFIEIDSNEEQFKLSFDLKGKWEVVSLELPNLTHLKVRTYEESQNAWKYVLTCEQE